MPNTESKTTDPILEILGPHLHLMKISVKTKKLKPAGYHAEIRHGTSLIWANGDGATPTEAVQRAKENYRR